MTFPVDVGVLGAFKGDKGDKGRPGTFDTATAVSVPADQPATATISGVAGEIVEFEIPRGLPGTNAVPADSAVAAYIAAPDSATGVQARAIFAALPGASKNKLTGWFHADGFGAVGDGVADDTAPLQAAIDAAQTGGGRVYLKQGTYKTTGLLLPSNVALVGESPGGQVGSPTKLVYAGTAGGTLLGPKDRATNTINWKIEGIDFNGDGLAGIILDFYRVSYSRMQDCAVYGGQVSTGVGVQLDANVVNQCYFNVFDNVKVDGLPIGVRFQKGANANRWQGGKIGNGGTGMEFLSASSGNIIIATDLEESTDKHIHVDAGGNVFIGLHMENAPIGYDITANGSGTRRIATTFASTVTTYVNDLSTLSGSLDEVTTDTYGLKLGSTSIRSKLLTGSTRLNIDPQPFSASASVVAALFEAINTSGARQFVVYRGNGTTETALNVDAGNRNVTLGNAGTTSAGGGQGVVPISNSIVAPASNPSGGGVMFVEFGILKYKGPTGTVTTIAPA